MALPREAFRPQVAVAAAPLAAVGIVVGTGLDAPPTADDASRAVQLVGQQIVDRAAVAQNCE